jgi:hypothetical protein
MRSLLLSFALITGIISTASAENIDLLSLIRDGYEVKTSFASVLILQKGPSIALCKLEGKGIEDVVGKCVIRQ